MKESIDYERIFEDLGTGIIVRDLSGKILHSNQSALDILGYTAYDFQRLSTDILSSLYVDEKGQSIAADDYPPVKALRENSILKDIILCKNIGDSKQWLSITSIPQYSLKSEKADSVLSIFFDVTDRKNAENQLQENKDFIQIVMDNIPQFIFWKDLKLHYLGCNSNFAKVSGVVESNRIIGKSDYDLAWREEEASAFREDDKRVIESGNPIYHIIEPQLHADGKKAWLDTNKIPLRDTAGSVRGILGTYEDITERILGEEELKRLRNYLVNIIDSMPSVIIGITKKYEITLWNKQATEVSEISAEDAVGRKITDVILWITPYMDLIDQVLIFGKTVQNKRTIRHGGKNRYYEDITIFPLENDTGIEGVVIRMDDVSESITLQEQLQKTKRTG